MLKRKLQFIFIALILTIATVIGPGCKDPVGGKKSSSEPDWGYIIFIIRILYYEHGVDPKGFARQMREPITASIPAPTGSIKTDMTDKGAGAGADAAAGAVGGGC